MPTYSYRCPDCGYAFDAHQHMSDPPITTCPNCGENNVRKSFGPTGVVFKGSGFYHTDSRAAAKK